MRGDRRGNRSDQGRRERARSARRQRVDAARYTKSRMSQRQRGPTRIQHFYFSLLRPSLTHYLHWLLHDHRSHPSSVIIKERPALRARLGENLTAEYSEVSAMTLVCV